MPMVAYAEKEPVETGAKIILMSYTVSSNPVKPGETVQIALTLENVGSYDASGVLLSYSIGNSMITPLYGEGNQVYIGTIPAGSQRECIINGLILSSVISDYALDYFSVVFKDNIAGDVSNSFMISVPVVHEGKLRIIGSAMSTPAIAGSTCTNVLDIGNYGNSAVYSIKLYAEEEDGTSALAGNLGNLGAGQTLSYNYQDVFSQPGKHRITVWLTYTDSSGEQWETEKTVTDVDVAESEQPALITDVSATTASPDNLPANNTFILRLIIGACVILLASVILLVLRRRKRYVE